MKKFAHKVAYIAGGIIIGVVFSTSAGAFADTVKSMVGKKVTGEYTLVVDGKKLSDKGAVIDSRANVPARALSEALGADVSVSGKTITITSQTEESTVGSESATPVGTSNKYTGQSKSSLEEQKSVLLDRILAPTKSGREDILKEIALLKEQQDRGVPVTNLEAFEKQLANYDADIAKYEADLKLIEEALATAK
ncbi:stalk domain-containing protein [Paenibacillus sp. OK076]|uniref:stalk domain-containing protein n=1 Tax=Paenibacillus sp. OK076 TaxID=1884379 RepID=UPI0008C4B497|nr:stalk domain-containing protein [Paenibacillus sp. OK076]SEO10927.1 Copper amine oxidase N-terminal domain-containing protein [Paenibacillus sp. OK076]